MRYYEFVFIVSPEVEEEDLEKVAARVGQMIVDGGGEVVRLESWGRRRLAYPIRRFREGHYVVGNIQMDPEAISGLKDRLGLTEEVIRYLLIRTDAVPVEAVPVEAVPVEAEPAVSPPEPVDSDQAEEEQPEEEPGEKPEEEVVEPEAALEQDSEETDEELQGD
ncbi:MAG TPA: 30S ribosomal protein S6 [Anaerolineae bacterium]|nr:30S ribosomal protein S6 [Anaerolineae bacterium]